MEAKELRIGNWVHVKSKNADEDIPVQLINIQDIETNCELFTYTPIPLTEEILLKCGFSMVDDVNKCYAVPINKVMKKYLHIHLAYYNVTLYDDFLKFKDIIIDKKYEHLHQLQNLYFALTGEELNFKND